jgi:aspartyl-tRNA(Asn)/glutamyl-tRNA(Gln) amidotransferase subunit A
LNPHDHDRIVGGSSSGSVNLVACGQAPFAIGTDTGDSVRRPASFVGVVGFKPTYGLISRYGVFPYAPSLDSIGINATNVTDTAIVADVICQYDQKDYSSQKMEHTFYKSLTTHKNICVGVIKDLEKHLSKDVLTYYLKAIDDIKKAGHTIKYIDLDETYLRSVHTIYYCLSYVEAYSCYMNITGITFGKNLGGNNYDEIITKNRTNGIGMEARARMIIGAYITKHNNFEKYFLRAQKIRR